MNRHVQQNWMQAPITFNMAAISWKKLNLRFLQPLIFIILDFILDAWSYVIHISEYLRFRAFVDTLITYSYILSANHMTLKPKIRRLISACETMASQNAFVAENYKFFILSQHVHVNLPEEIA